MAITIIDWPLTLAYKSIDLIVDWKTQSAGAPLIGDEQVVLSHAEHWTGTITFNTLRPEWVRAYRAFIGASKGKFGAIRLPIFDGPNGPTPSDTGATEQEGFDGTPFDDGVLFDDGAGWDASLQFNPLVQDVAIGDETLVMDLSDYPDFVLEGRYFNLGTFCHMCLGTYVDPITNHTYVDIEPPAREAIESSAPGDSLFTWPPYLVCAFKEDLTGRHDLDFGRYTTPQLEVIEVIER